MSTPWKLLLGLALVLPLGGFVAGSLVASSADAPRPRETIQIGPATGDRPQPPTTTRSPVEGASEGSDVEDVTPSPDDIDDPADDEGRDSEDADDHGGDRDDDERRSGDDDDD